jgi:hypothetical protein
MKRGVLCLALALGSAACGDDVPNPGLQVVDAGGDACMPSASDDDGGDGEACGAVCGSEHPHDRTPAPHISAPWPASAYNSSPPSSGGHCAEWSSYGVAYDEAAPLPACYFLHNLEHGAVVLLYNCPEGCPEVVAELEALVASPPQDPNCAASRILLTPYAEMDAKVAAAAWGFTWTSDCLEGDAIDSLRAFVEAHQGTRGDAPEPRVCVDGAIRP